MRVVVVGGGKVGVYLARHLSKTGQVVSVIEEKPERARKVTAETKVLVFEGDGTDIELLRAADVHRSDWVLAVTGQDEDNLVAAQLSLTLGAKHVLARMNDPANKATFDALGIQYVAVTDLMVSVISTEVAVPDFQRTDLFAGGKVIVLELDIPNDFEATRVQDLDLPGDAVLVTVVHGDQVSVVRGDSRVRPGDRVIAASLPGSEGAVCAVFGVDRNSA
jgi:trk system potassium uptake protein TrkA